MIRAILTDIEGTTSSIAFVAQVLFPYARARLRDYCAAHADEVAPILANVAATEPGDPIDTLLAWIDADRKATPLKDLQGRIWRAGYADRAFTGHIYPDAAAALRRWHARGLKLYVFSSGSVEAQHLLFAHSDEGDLCALFAGHFDTTTGPKREAASYARIAEAIGLPPPAILFLSDTPEEVTAARAARLQALRIDRESDAGDVRDFAGVERWLRGVAPSPPPE